MKHRDELKAVLDFSTIKFTKENPWPFENEDGDGERGLFVLNPETKKLERVKTVKKIVDAPYVIPDEIPPTEYMGNENREMFTSKKELEKRTKADGFEIVGHKKYEPIQAKKYKANREEINEDIRRSVNDLKYGNMELSEMQKQRAIEEKRRLERYKERVED